MWVQLTVCLVLVMYMCHRIHGQLPYDCDIINHNEYRNLSSDNWHAMAFYSCRRRFNRSLTSVKYKPDGSGYQAACCRGENTLYYQPLDNCQFFYNCYAYEWENITGHNKCYKNGQFVESLYHHYINNSSCDNEHKSYLACCTRDVGTWQILYFRYNTLHSPATMELCQYNDDSLDCQRVSIHIRRLVRRFTPRIYRMDYANVFSDKMLREDLTIVIAFQGASNITWYEYTNNCHTYNICSQVKYPIVLNNRTCRNYEEKYGGEYFGENENSCAKCNCSDDYTCHPITGKCICHFGYIGKNCDTQGCSSIAENYRQKTYNWSATPVGFFIKSDIGYLYRMCKLDSTWDVILTRNELISKLDGQLSLNNMYNRLNRDQLGNITSTFHQYVRVSLDDEEVAESLLSKVSELMTMDAKVLHDPNYNHTQKTLSFLEFYSSNVHIPEDKENISLIFGNINIVVKDVNSTTDAEIHVDTHFSNRLNCNPGPSLTINQSLLYNDPFRLSIIGYRTAKLFHEKTNSNRNIYPVISVTVNGTLPKQVSTNDTILTYVIPRDINDTRNTTCVYWVEHNNTWISKDIITTIDEQGRTICMSPHLSIFSMLLQNFVASKWEKESLKYITNIGLGISIIGLSLTIVIYLMFPNLRSRGQILLCLCVSMLLLNLVFLIGSEKYHKYGDWLCTAAAICIHYFLLTTLVWMMLEAFFMYQKLVMVFPTAQSHYLLKCSLVGWGLPALIVAMTAGVSVAVSTNVYQADGKYCILTHSNPTQFYCAVFGPVCFMLVVNTCVFIRVLIIILRKGNKHSTNRRGRSNHISIRQVQGSLSVMIILGVTWIFGPMSKLGAELAFVYLFTILNSFQGLLIFVFQCVLHKEVQRAVIHFYRTGRRKQVKGSDNLVKRTNKTSKSTDDTSR